jgi:hypothetical protein
MRQAREQIENQKFDEFQKSFVSKYKTRDADLEIKQKEISRLIRPVRLRSGQGFRSK